MPQPPLPPLLLRWQPPPTRGPYFANCVLNWNCCLYSEAAFSYLGEIHSLVSSSNLGKVLWNFLDHFPFRPEVVHVSGKSWEWRLETILSLLVRILLMREIYQQDRGET